MNDEEEPPAQVLFEPGSLSGDFETGRKERARIAARSGGGVIAFAQNSRDELRYQGDGDVSGALSANPGIKQTTYVCEAVTQYGPGIAGSLMARHNSSPCADRGYNVLCVGDDNARAAVDED